jgi:hypothetical protein
MMGGTATAAVMWYPTRTAQTALPRFKNIKITSGNTVGVCVCVRASKILGHELNFLSWLFLRHFLNCELPIINWEERKLVDWLTHRPLYPLGMSPGTQLIEGWVGSGTGVDVLDKRESLAFAKM